MFDKEVLVSKEITVAISVFNACTLKRFTTATAANVMINYACLERDRILMMPGFK